MHRVTHTGWFLLLGLSFFSLLSITAPGVEPLTLDSYLHEVKAKNQSVSGSIESSHGSKERREERHLAFAPTLFGTIQTAGDSKLQQIPIFTYQQLTNDVYQLGVSQLTHFGLQARFFYELDFTSFENAVLPGAPPGAFPTSFYDARPVLELSESLWGNGFGRSANANSELIDAQSAANEKLSRWQARSLLSQAEAAYWRLLIAREMVRIEKRALEQAMQIHDYTARRARMHLGEKADELQSKAALELRRLELKSANDEERVASRNFNTMRNIRSDDVAEALTPLESKNLLEMQPIKRAAMRDDVQAAKEQTRATTAAATLTVEKDKPTLDVYGSFALNGRDLTVDGALGNSYTAQRPTKMIGLKLSVPLDLSAAESARHGAIRERDAAEMIYHQKVLDQEQTWDDLLRKLEEAKERLSLSEIIERAQDEKLVNERQRLKNGRTTTYQVLLFEQDFSQSELARLRSQSDVVTVLAEMKLFSGDDL